MKKIWMICGVALVITACGNDTAEVNQDLKTVEQKVDAGIEKLDTALEKTGDSIKAKAQVIGSKVRNKWKAAKDSLRKDSVDL